MTLLLEISPLRKDLQVDTAKYHRGRPPITDVKEPIVASMQPNDCYGHDVNLLISYNPSCRREYMMLQRIVNGWKIKASPESCMH